MFLLIDGNNVAWAGYYALERAMKPEDDERRHRVAMLGLASGVLGAIARRGEPPGAAPGPPLTRVALVFDEGRAVRRRGIFPKYQTGRESDPKFVANEPVILRAIDEFAGMAARILPIEVVQGADTEADELIAGLVATTPGVPKRIISTDRDFLHLISKETSVYAPVKKLVIDERNFWDAVAPKASDGTPALFPRERFLDYRTLVGDTSDDLPGVPGIGPLSAARLLVAAPVEDYFGQPERVRAALGRRSEAVEHAFASGAAQAVVERNRAMMDLRLAAPSWDELPGHTRRGSWDRAAFEAWLDEQRITSVERAALLESLDQLAAAG